MKFLNFLFLGLTSCAYLSIVSMTNIPKDRSQKVSVSVEKDIFLFLNFNND